MPFTRDELYHRLDRRFDAMLAAGLVEEVRTLHRRGDLTPELPSLVGQSPAAIYKQLFDYRTGARVHPQMTQVARQLALPDLASSAETVARFRSTSRFIRFDFHQASATSPTSGNDPIT